MGLMSVCRGGFRRRGQWAVLQLAGVGLLIIGAITLGLVASAGADLSQGQTVPNAAQAQGSVTPGPFDSGQKIDVVVPANSLFNNPNQAIKILECSAPNDQIPTQTSQCDGNTIATVFPENGGSFDYLNDGQPAGFPIYDLPDSNLGDSPSGPQCGNTPATECVLYIGTNQQDFTQPHVWSQAFFMHTDPVDSGTVNPGDGTAPPVASAPDPALSSVIAAPTTAVANGVDQSTVTVTLLGTGAVPVQGKAVTLTPSSATAKVAGPSPALTDSSGQTTFSVTDAAAQVVTLAATDSTDNVPLTQSPMVTFQAATVSPTHSSVAANPTTVTAPVTSTTITVTLRDQGINPQPVSGDSVTLSGTGNAVVDPTTPVATNASGVATFTATDPDAETVMFTATDSTKGIPITNKASVTFGTLTVSGAKSTVSAQSPAQVGPTGTTAVVTLLTPSGNPVPGKSVSLQITSSGSSASIGSPSAGASDANGEVSFHVSDSVAETITLQATDTTDNVPLSTQPTVTFAASAPSAGASNITASASTSPADGETGTLIVVTVNDQFGNPLSGKTVTLQPSPTGDIQEHPIAIGASQPGVTDATGVAHFVADDTKAETVTFGATDTTDNAPVGVVLSKTVSVTYLPLAADPTGVGTTVTVSPANPPADGATPATVTVTMGDFFANPIAGDSISLAGLNGSSNIATKTAVTNQSGKATFTVTDPTAEVVTYQATDVTAGNTVLTSEGVVTFGTPAVPPPAVAFCSVSANPASVPADGSSPATVSVLLYDGSGDPVPGKTVTLSGSSGASTVTAATGTTNNSGMATFNVTDATAESVTYTATDTTDAVALTALTVKITFTAAAVTTTTTTSTTTTTPGSSTTSTTALGGGVSSSDSSLVATGTTGNSGGGSGSGSTAALANTGTPTELPWLIGVGVLFLAVGSIGRRRLGAMRRRADSMEDLPHEA